MFQRKMFFSAIVLAMAISWQTTCGGPSSAELVVGDPEVKPGNTIKVGGQAGINIQVSGPNPVFEWSALRGTVVPKDQAATNYTAPNSPGNDTVTVKVSGGGGSVVKSIPFIVEPLPTITPTIAPPSPTIASTNLPPPTTAPTNTPTTVPILTPTIPPTDTPTPSPTPPLPIVCNHLSITRNVFPQLQSEAEHFAFYGPPEDAVRFKCQGVYTRFKSPPLAVRIEYISDKAAGNFGFWGIATPKGNDISKFTEICFYVYVEQPNQAFQLNIKDTSPKEIRLKQLAEEPNKWTEICQPLSDYSNEGLDLSKVENINLGFNTTSSDATLWVDDFVLK